MTIETQLSVSLYPVLPTLPPQLSTYYQHVDSLVQTGGKKSSVSIESDCLILINVR